MKKKKQVTWQKKIEKGLRFMEKSNWDFEQKSEPIIPKIERQIQG